MPKYRTLKALCGALLLCLPLTWKADAETWTEVTSPHFRVLTDGGAQQGRSVAANFEQMRHVLALQFNDQSIGSSVPLTVVAAQDRATFSMLEPAEEKRTGGNLAGEFHRGWEKQFATVILDTGMQSQVVVFHEYTHSVLHARAHWLPIWLDEGLAELYGYTRMEQSRTIVGAPSQRMAALTHQSLLPVNEMLDTTNESKLLRDASRGNLFYAEAWAMVHYMMFGKGMEGGAKLNVFFGKLQSREPQKQAFQEVFGDSRAFDSALTQYVHAFGFTAAALPADEKLDSKQFAVRKLTPAETEYELGCFQIGAHEVKLGRERIEKAIALDPKLAGAHEELAFLEFREGKDAEAVKEWHQAVDLDPTRARSVFALAMTGVPLSEQTPEQLQATAVQLQHVNQLSPGFAAPYVELSLVEWRLHHLQKAYDSVRKAEELEPWRAGYHVLGADILLAGKQPALAAQASRFVAEHWNGPDHNEAVDLWNELPPDARGSSNFTFDYPAGAKVEHGTLRELSCGSGPGTATVVTFVPAGAGAMPEIIKSEKPFMVGFSDSFWWGEDHFTLCHHLTGHTAVVAYQPDTHQLLDLEIRDDLPAPVTAVASSDAAAPAHAVAEPNSTQASR